MPTDGRYACVCATVRVYVAYACVSNARDQLWLLS